MISLRIPPLARRQNLRNDLPLPPLLIRQFRDLSRYPLLLRIVVENTGTVLRAGVWTLTVRGCWVVHLVKEFDELAVGDLLGIVGYLEGFGICAISLSAIDQRMLPLCQDREWRKGKWENVRPVLPEHTAL